MLTVSYIQLVGPKWLIKTYRGKIACAANGASALFGGFLGQLLGRIPFNQKTNFKRHPAFAVALIISVALWAGLVFCLHFKG